MQLLNKKRKLLGNKGFSLVELIIVIAIMAVLVAILVPQYIQYVEKSRVSADDTFADSLKNAVNVILSDDANSQTINEDFTVTWTDKSVVVAGNDNAAVATALANSLTGYATKPIQSNKYKTTYNTYTITVSFATGAGVISSAVWSKA